MTQQLLNKKLDQLQREVETIRNICILAHVDHGKTTLADSLVAANGIISSRMAGKMRYMDSRKDEQERGITMKSSAIALYYPCQDKEYIINLMDSPGHVDFSSEVCTAVRLCDGAIVIVDVVEGVQPQTKVVLQQAWEQGIKPILVINKIDRLIVEMKLEPKDAYTHIKLVLEQVNAVMGELFTTSVLSSQDIKIDNGKEQAEQFKEGEVYDWSSGLEDVDDSHLYFDPSAGNVILSSAYDGWAFSIDTFANIYATKLKMSESVLRKTLWGDFFLNAKERKIMKGALIKNKKPLFVQLVLDNIWSMYQTILIDKDKEKLEKMTNALGLKIAPRDLRTTDMKQLLSAVMSVWLPIADSVLTMVCQRLPPPNELGRERSKMLMCPQTVKFESLPEKTQNLLEDFSVCSADENAPKIIFVSKMIAVNKNQLPQHKAKMLTTEEMKARRDAARERHQERLQSSGTEGAIQLSPEQLQETEQKEESKDEIEFIAFARIFSGQIKPGDEIFVLGPKYDPGQSGACLDEGDDIPENSHACRATISSVYLLLGRDLEHLGAGFAGNIVGLSGLGSHVLKSATLSSSPWVPPFVELVHSTYPILRVAVEPFLSSDLGALAHGLQLLNQADAHVEVVVSEAGEHLLVTAGEVHLQRCILDLTEAYAKCEISVSEPIVPFRETIVPVPETDMVNEVIEYGDDKATKEAGDQEQETEYIEQETPNKQCSFRIRAIPLPAAFTIILQDNYVILKASSDQTKLSTKAKNDLEELKAKLLETINNSESLITAERIEKIISFGPKRCGPNVLINETSALNTGSVWTQIESKDKSDTRIEYINSLINGFQLASMNGPICEEQMMGVGFVLEDWVMGEETDTGWGPLSGQIVSTVKDACRKAFQKQPQRLMTAMYTCEIFVKAEVLGRLYGVISRRLGQVVKEDLVEGSSTFSVTAHIPVVESFDFSNELRKQTSGLALPQLVFTHWETVNIDPYWIPRTEEELVHFGEKADSENQARKYMNMIKKRKGLKIDEKIVEFAEKQRTLTKSK